MSAPAKIIAITGGSSGIGAEMSQYFAAAGWDVAITFANNRGGADEVVDAIKAAGRRAVAVHCDVGYKDQVDNFLDTVTEQLGLPDIFVNNAGVQTWSSFLDLAEEDWDRTIRTNLKGYFLCTQAYARRCVDSDRPGAVVMIGSGCNKVPFPRLVDYSASKGGIENLTQVAAIELGPHRIRVNCVAPGAIEIERTRQEAPDYARTWGGLAPLRRVGYSLDIARAVEYFGSENASYVTGQTLYVDGGVFTLPAWPDYE
ncbi:MAG: SDR family oxidoreductase [Halioglobus sp.]|nr:SDR family oxidoreductase [Halioglobus sp.]